MSSTPFQPYSTSAFVGRPDNVGIKAMDFYVPSHFVAQSDLEQHDGVSEGQFACTAYLIAASVDYPGSVG
jgi:hypothetical protein